ncbi:MAG: Gfo/Idh/MocA family oxidoreductase [Mobilicoccus sp.]|nr:Gfo/Idh/MocA family oxidoreductase [Mobilicoccus sp.]
MTLPTSRRPAASDVPALRWGVLGTGWIAQQFIDALRGHTTQQVVAVGSRSAASAQEAATRLGVETAYPSYEQLVAADDVDVVYVATPHPQHLENALLAIAAGKHVLVEKPFAINADEARRIASAAQAAGVFCAEAMWTLFLPKYDVLRQVLADGMLGDLTTVVADMGEWFEHEHRIFDPALAGGAMLDLGTYPITLATWAFGDAAPIGVVGEGTRSASGVTGQFSAGLDFGDGRLASLAASIEADLPTRATIAGTQGRVDLERCFYQPGAFDVILRDGRTLRYEEEPIAHAGLFHEALEVARCIDAGLTETPIRPLAATVFTLSVMDRVRATHDDVLVGE